VCVCSLSIEVFTVF